MTQSVLSNNLSSLHSFDPSLTKFDRLVLQNLLEESESTQLNRCPGSKSIINGVSHAQSPQCDGRDPDDRQFQDEQPEPEDERVLRRMQEMNNPAHEKFMPTTVLTWDAEDLAKTPQSFQVILQRYTLWARTIVRHETDVVMITHLLLYLFTSIPSAIYLYFNFTYYHGLLHTLTHIWYAGSYTLMMHQHIHMRGLLAKKYAWLDHVFPYVTDPLMGHTWNSFYFHHVKHHHVESNGPHDLSSTIRYQRDSIRDFSQYVGRFFFWIWLELPLYFFRKGQWFSAFKAAASELGTMMFYLLISRVNLRATIFVFLLPLFVTRIGLMIGNWGQHAFVDDIDPDSDYRSSITLIDVSSNRYCFNDGYHTSHHLNPRRHWREHPLSFIKQKRVYAKESALVFCNIDYFMITVRLLQKDYTHLAKCLVPIGDQIGMSIPEIAAMLETKTRRFSEDEIRKKFKDGQSA